jgi:hypothetical protein
VSKLAGKMCETSRSVKESWVLDGVEPEYTAKAGLSNVHLHLHPYCVGLVQDALLGFPGLAVSKGCWNYSTSKY